VFRDADVNVGKVTLSKVSWFVSHVLQSDESKLKLYKIIERKAKLNIGYRMSQCHSISVSQSTLSTKSNPEKPRWIIVGFQTEKHRPNDQEKNPAVFDHVHVRNMYVTLNAVRYPTIDFNASFTHCRAARLYKEAADLAEEILFDGQPCKQSQHDVMLLTKRQVNKIEKVK